MRRVTQVLAWLAPEGGLSSPLRSLLARTGLSQVLTTRAAIVDLLEDEDVTVPYRERSAPLGLDRFPLALDGHEHAAARTLVAEALHDSHEAHLAGCADAARLAETAVVGAGPGGAVDLVADVVDPALVAWVERWFGLPGQGPELLRCGRLITHATFLNPPLPEARVDLDALRLAADHLTTRASTLAGPLADAPPGTLGHALLQRTSGDVPLATQHLLGLTVGPLALGSKATATVLDGLLDEPWTIESLAEEPPDGAAAEDTFRRLLRSRPPLPGVLRHNPSARRVVGGRHDVTVPEGLVLAATSCPAHRGDDGSPDLVFGYGRHTCMGIDQVTRMGALVLGVVARGRPRRQDGAPGRLRDAMAPSGVRRWPFPGWLEVVVAG